MKRKTTADGQQSAAPLVEEANAAAAECGDDCQTSELVASESDEPETTKLHGTSTEPGNLQEPDPKVLSVPKSDDRHLRGAVVT